MVELAAACALQGLDLCPPEHVPPFHAVEQHLLQFTRKASWGYLHNACQLRTRSLWLS